jgi:hypothetical protein
MASEAVQGVRLQAVDADAAVARLMERLLLRRRQREGVEALPTQERQE